MVTIMDKEEHFHDTVNLFTVRGGYLFSTDRAGILHRLIRSCAGRLRMPNGPGGEIALRRCARRPLRVTVTPLRSRGNVAELTLWPKALARLADAIEVAQIGLATHDHRTNGCDVLAPRVDPLFGSELP